jgi:diacylglycerol O-acyltransferase / wax synthase
MAYTHFERLSALDDSFLEIEDGNSHMHIGAVAVFEGGPLATPEGGVDIERVRTLMEAGLHRFPRYRQRLEPTPVFGQPVWVDDRRFNLAYHVRHTHLPRPGDQRQLKRLVGRLMSQELDRGKPLWEMWVVEGLDDKSFAIVTKAHHCMIDGVGSVELTGSVMRPTPEPDPSLAEPPPPWVPRPVPSPSELLFAELSRRVWAPFAAAGSTARAITAPRAAVSAARDTMTGLGRALGAGFSPASPTPLNVEIGPHRRFDWTVADLESLKATRTQHGGTVNDVVLAVLAGALGRFFYRRGIETAHLDFRVMVPVNVRDESSRLDAGNRVAMMVAKLPLQERDPVRRLEMTIAETRRMKASHQARGMQAIEELSDWTFTTLMSAFARLTTISRPYNIVVTNVPGPSFPVYVSSCRMTACYPLVPLFANQALGVALFSYQGRLYWGFNADWDAVPDLHELVEAVEHELEIMASLGTATTGASAPAPGEAAAS